MSEPALVASPSTKNAESTGVSEECLNRQQDPLSKEDIDQFVRDGFVLLEGAFSGDVAQKCRELIWARLSVQGIEAQDTSTWVERHGIPELYTQQDIAVWGQVLGPRLRAAVDQLCGKDRWEEFGCGWWMITFPGFHQEPWDAAGKWHVDGASYQHHIDSAESGLLAIFLFSDISRSHRSIARLLQEYEPAGLKGGAVSYHARKLPRHKVVEVNGKAGDVMLVHPFLLHARSKNLGQRGVDSVRIMCNPNVKLHEKMNLNRDDDNYSPVETAIVQALQQRRSRKPKRRREDYQ
ncbi:TPA: hypothetical protein N0F65_000163 [Lagenidium giganteum]|uniref:Phytanoyl-CoA dioxygenase n=1 Tax=Lagenidium giganteum TaxID=4803 RepID=A0AAV2YTP1_9STRA|nr:TPA: hypothetical protein N0F65_000163 [Lagenidium giganteum]